MGSQSKISWTDATWNTVRGCSKVSRGCENCYAARIAHRFSGEGQPYHGYVKDEIAWGKPYPTWSGLVSPIEDKLEEPLRWKRPRMVFVNSMSDTFHPNVPFVFVDKIMDTIRRSPAHTFQVLTKRADRMRHYFASRPNIPDNLWIGVTAEDNDTYERRVPFLMEIEAPVKFVSMEPLLGLIDMDRSQMRPDWVIVGGESGPHARPMHPDWAIGVLKSCNLMGIPFFFKQWGAWKPVDWDPDNPSPSKANERYVSIKGGSGFHGSRVVKVAKSTPKKNGNCLILGKTYEEFPRGK